eukprot:gene9637-12976_t
MSDIVPFLKKLNNYGLNGTKRDIRGSAVGEILRGYESLLELIPDTETVALTTPTPLKSPLTHKKLKQFLKSEFDLSHYGIEPHSRVAVLLPNGPEFAIALISVVSKYCAAPINPANSAHEIIMELKSTKSIAIIILKGAMVNAAATEAANSLGIGIIEITAKDNIIGLFNMNLVAPVAKNLGPPSNIEMKNYYGSYGHPETVLYLHTSGTSGNKKLVPYSLDMIMIGVGCIIASWNLGPGDVCLNMMPLFHIGGIVRNIFSPILAGGSVITCPGFDPVLFWDVLTNQGFTWYYAAPTMHHAILTEAETRPKPLPVGSVRFIANAAGGLLPVLAIGLRNTFNAVILTSYGMTECMPISSPPQTYNLEPTGTSGISMGPDIMIVDDDLHPVDIGVKGNIFIRGPPTFGGYENNGAANDESFFTINGETGWFNTGDMGNLDNEGYLFISGRSKEIINKGGETISPFEIEEVVMQHPLIKETLAFSAPHEKYQETVGAIVVSRPGKPRVDLPSLHKYLDNKLHRSKWPQVLVYSDALPKNAAGKILRIKYADRTNMPNVDEETSPITRIYEASCPPVGAPLTQTIQLNKINIDTELTKFFLLRQDNVESSAVVTVNLPFQQDAVMALIVVKKPFLAVAEKQQESDFLLNLKTQCDSFLNHYISPQSIFIVTSLASNDTKDLQALAFRLYQEKNVVAPRNDTEFQIEKIWRKQLGSPTVLSVNVSFFDLGGDSLKAGILINAMRKKMKCQLSVADLLAEPTIAGLATKISTMKSAPGTPRRDRSQSPTRNGFQSPEKNGNNGLSSLMKGKGSLSQPLISTSESYNSLSMDDNEEGAISGASSDRGSNISNISNLKEEYIKLRNKLLNMDAESLDSDLTDQTNKYTLMKEFPNLLKNTTFGCLFFQALPIVLFYPLRRILIWFLVVILWVTFMAQGHIPRLYALLMALGFASFIINVASPLLGIALKWMVIGRYKPGKYQLWSAMYLKWWIAEQLIEIMGKGYFTDDLPIIGGYLSIMYYRLMGAKIGRNCKISKEAKLGQYDLITLGDDVAIDKATVLPFGLEEGFFVLLPITLGDRCSVGAKSIVAPGAQLPPDTAIGPQSSSHEADEDSKPEYRNYCRQTFSGPPWYLVVFVGIPIIFITEMFTLVPWYFFLKFMVTNAAQQGWYDGDISSVWDAIHWYTTPLRIMYYLSLKVILRVGIPPIKLVMIIIIKWLVIGKFEPLNEEEYAKPWNRFKYWLMGKLMAGGSLIGVANLVGTHYEIISIIYRLLGAKIGKRVYWPGSGIDIVEYDLLTIGDDVVFGSRSAVLTSSRTCSKPVKFEAGCMIADRCVILPGVTIGKGAILGSGSIAHEDFEAPMGSVWVGSRYGRPVNVAPADFSYENKETITPFGLAFYQGKANFFVIPLWGIVLYSTFMRVICTTYHVAPTVITLVCAIYLRLYEFEPSKDAFQLLKLLFLIYIPVNIIMSMTALGIDIGAKWAIMGKRKEGSYPWDKSSYCQRWQLYLTIAEIRRGERGVMGTLDSIRGSQYLVWYFRMLGAKIGRSVCLYPNGGDPMMTEPDLVTIGDLAGIDEASLVAHINTRGNFKLNPLMVKAGAVLKAHTRLLSGAAMEAESMLLEHTLVMSGEVVDTGSVWQGWPSRAQMTRAQHRRNIDQCLEEGIETELERKRRKNGITIYSKVIEKNALGLDDDDDEDDEVFNPL